jgi:hypothetical protein
MDPKNSEVDVVQAVGRAMRLSDTKTIGTIFVPVVVPEEQDFDNFINSSEFKKVAQVVRALRAIDDGFEVRISKLAEREGRGGGRAPKEPDIETRLDFDSLPEELRKQLQTKIVKIGLGIRGTPLSIEGIKKAILEYKHRTGKWPAQNTPGPIPDMPNESWQKLDYAGRYGQRGLQKGMQLSNLVKALCKEPKIVERGVAPEIGAIKEAVLTYRKKTGNWPSSGTTAPVPGLPNETWKSLYAAGRKGWRGMQKSMVDIMNSVRKQCGERVAIRTRIPLDFNVIRRAIVIFKSVNGSWPSQLTQGSVPGIPDDTWRDIDRAGQDGARGIEKGLTLHAIKKSLVAKLGKDLEHLDPNININDTAALESFLKRLGL